MTDWAADEKKNVSTANFYSSALSIKHGAYTCECAANCWHDIAHHHHPDTIYPSLASFLCHSANSILLLYTFFSLVGVCECVCEAACSVLSPCHLIQRRRWRCVHFFLLNFKQFSTNTRIFFCFIDCDAFKMWVLVLVSGESCAFVPCGIVCCVACIHLAAVNARVRAKLLRWMPFVKSRCVRNARGEWMRRWNRKHDVFKTMNNKPRKPAMFGVSTKKRMEIFEFTIVKTSQHKKGNACAPVRRLLPNAIKWHIQYLRKAEMDRNACGIRLNWLCCMTIAKFFGRS